jgi:hypothetical protein
MLANDVCRCHNEDCVLKNSCARYKERCKGSVNTPHTTFEPPGALCSHYWPRKLSERLTSKASTSTHSS